MQIDPTELMPEPTGFIAFKGEGNRYFDFKFCLLRALSFVCNNWKKIPQFKYPTGLMGRKRRPPPYLKNLLLQNQFSTKEVSLIITTKLGHLNFWEILNHLHLKTLMWVLSIFLTFTFIFHIIKRFMCCRLKTAMMNLRHLVVQATLSGARKRDKDQLWLNFVYFMCPHTLYMLDMSQFCS